MMYAEKETPRNLVTLEGLWKKRLDFGWSRQAKEPNSVVCIMLRHQLTTVKGSPLVMQRLITNRLLGKVNMK